MEPVQGYVEGESTEDRSLWTPTSRTWRNPDNSLTSKLYGSVVNFADAAGVWQAIDSTIVSAGDSFRLASAPYDVRFGATSSSATLMSFEYKGTKVAFAPPLGARSNIAPVVESNRITYEEILPGVDVRYVVGRSTVKEDVILKSAPSALLAAPVFQFPLSVSGGSIAATAAGGFDVFNDSGDLIFELPAGFMADADPGTWAPNKHGAVTLSLVENPVAGQVVEVVPNLAWLLDPARVYPVYVDPSIQLHGNTCYWHGQGCDANGSYSSANAYSADAAVYQQWPDYTWDQNWVAALNPPRWSDDVGGEDGPYERVSYLHYDLRTIHYSDVSYGHWQAYHMWKQYGGDHWYRVQPTAGPWSDGTGQPDPSPANDITWNRRLSGYGSTHLNYSDKTVGTGWHIHDVTDWVQTWAGRGWADRGVQVHTAGSGNYRFRRIAAHENGDGSDSYFQVTHYDPPPDTPVLQSPPHGSASKTAPQLVARYRDRNREPGQIVFRIETTSGAYVTQSPSTLTNCGECDVAWTPVGLAAGTYQWRAYAYDDTSASSWSAARTFTIDATNPLPPSTITSSHLPYVPSADRTVDVSWSGASDDATGIAGYSWAFNRSSGTPADASLDTGGTQAVSGELADGDWWFHVRSIDGAMNVSEDRVYGPIRIDGASLLGGLTASNEAQSDQNGLEQFAPYSGFDAGNGDGFVHLGTGNVAVTYDTATVPAVGLNLVVRHAYNSDRATVDTGLGNGWNLSVTDLDAGLDDIEGAIVDLDPNRELIPLEIGEILDGVYQITGLQLEFTDGDGTTHRFVRKGLIAGSRWESPPGVSLRVREVVSSGLVTAYELIRPDGVIYRAENRNNTGNTWRIVSITDRNGNALSYRYGQFGTPAKTRLTEVYHNRHDKPLATFSWTTSGHLTRIMTLKDLSAADPATGTSRSWARTIDFNVDAATRRLTWFAENTHGTPTGGFGASRTTNLGYHADGRLHTIGDGRNDTTRLAYTAPGDGTETVVVTDREDKAWRWALSAPNATTGERTTTATTPLGAETKYRVSGRSPISDTDKRVAGGNIAEIRDAGADAGAVVTSYVWTANRLTSTTDGAGAVTSYEYNDLGLLTEVTEPAPNTPGSGVPAGAPTGTVVSTIDYNFPSAYTYSGCVQPAATAGPVHNGGWCAAAAEMTRVALATNVSGQLRVNDFHHDANGNLTAAIERGVPSLTQAPSTAPSTTDRATSFTYYSRGGLRSIDGPRPGDDVVDRTVWGNDLATDAYGGYDRTGMPTRVVDALGKAKTLAYTPYGMTAKVVDRDNNTTTSRFDERDNLVEVTDPQSRVTTFSYDGNDNKTAERTTVAAVTLETRWNLDGNDRLTTTDEPGATPTSPRGISTNLWRADGRKDSETNRSGVTTRFGYHPNGLVKEQSEPTEGTAAAVTTWVYDGAGRLVRTIHPAANANGNRPVTAVTYTPAGLPDAESETAFTGAAGNTDRIVRRWYNAHGEPIETRGPRTDSVGNPQKTTSIFDTFGQETHSRRWLDAVRYLETSVDFDAAGNQKAVRQPAGTDTAPITLESTYRFDALNQLAEQTKDPVNPGRTVSYAYNGEGQQTRRIDRHTANGATRDVRTTTYDYNPDGTRRSQISTDHASGEVLASCNFDDPTNPSAGYDEDGNLLVSHTRTGGCATTNTIQRTQRLTYDHRGWVTATDQSVRSPKTAQLVTRSQTFTYNPDGTRTTATHDGKTTTYELTPAAWMDAATDWRGVRSTVDYHPSGAPREINLGAGNVIGTFAYGVDGMPAVMTWTKAGGTAIRAHTDVTYDVGGLRTAEKVSVTNPDGTTTTGNAAYSFDLLDRLTGYTSPYLQRTGDLANPATTYTLDRAGNIATEVTTVLGVERSRATATYTNGRLTSRQTTTTGDAITGVPETTVDDTFAYNDLGEEKTQSSTTTEATLGGLGTTTTTSNTAGTGYDPAGYTRTVDNSTSDKADVKYVYDTADRVVSRTETSNGTTATTLYFYWGSGGAIAEETDGSGNTKVRYLVDTGDEHLAQQSYRTTATGDRDLTDTTGTWTWLLQDLAGNTATKLHANGTVAEHAAFDPYGRPEPSGTKKAAGDTTPSTHGFQGAQTDKATGAVLLGARQYDPTAARFTTPDTFVAGALDLELGTDSLTGNRYLFAAANPVAYFEDGHWPRIKVPNPIKSAARAVKNVAKKTLPLLSFVPVVGTAIDVVSAATGRDWLNGGKKLTGAERALMLAGAAAGMIPGAGIAAKASLKVAAKAATKS